MCSSVVEPLPNLWKGKRLSKIHWTHVTSHTSQLIHTGHWEVKFVSLRILRWLRAAAQCHCPRWTEQLSTTFPQPQRKSKLKIWSMVYSESVYFFHNFIKKRITCWTVICQVVLFSLSVVWCLNPLLSPDSLASDLSPTSDSCSSWILTWLPPLSLPTK